MFLLPVLFIGCKRLGHSLSIRKNPFISFVGGKVLSNFPSDLVMIHPLSLVTLLGFG